MNEDKKATRVPTEPTAVRPLGGAESNMRGWQETLEACVGVPFTTGNGVLPLRNGREIFPAMLEAIESAASSVHFVTFVYWEGDIAGTFAKALGDAARRGVEVRVVLDSVGARTMDPELVSRMEGAGVQVAWFRPVRLLHLGKATHRTHRKILICDGRAAFTGGVGIAEEWTGDAGDSRSWRETHFRFTGPCVAGIQAAFLDNWITARPEDPCELTDTGRYLPAAGDALAQVVRSRASIESSDISMNFRAILAAAQRQVRITTPYFTPDEQSMNDMLKALERGVEVQLLIPGPEIDYRLSRLAARDFFGRLLEAGGTVRLFQPTMLHAKIMTVDGLLSVVGSANFNQRSMRKDDELVVNVLSRSVAKRLDSHFEEDVQRSRDVDLGRWKNRGFAQRLLEIATRPFHGEM